MWVTDGGRLNGELLRLSSCKLVRTDAITLTSDTRPSITFTLSSNTLHIQMGAVCVCVRTVHLCTSLKYMCFFSILNGNVLKQKKKINLLSP